MNSILGFNRIIWIVKSIEVEFVGEVRLVVVVIYLWPGNLSQMSRCKVSYLGQLVKETLELNGKRSADSEYILHPVTRFPTLSARCCTSPRYVEQRKVRTIRFLKEPCLFSTTSVSHRLFWTNS